MWARRWIAAGAASVALLSLSACTVEPGGVAAIGVDASGQPVGYLLMCEGSVDGATLYHDTSAEDDSSVTDGTWAAPEPVTAAATWSLTAPTDGWVTEEPLAAMTEDMSYSLYGWSRDNDWSAAHHSFTLADLETLEPGEVAFTKVTDDGEETTRVIPAGDLTPALCSDLTY
ncbi:hypothetical protein FE697_020430 [Mumia zhuanghuii]|uniref:Uncharacterized protein n=2 Tax=Mumia TaxID=1546255 RepID=A0ABW1QKW2_9ACTN|nr:MULTISPECIES: hypothetical protein [Mumia]KAA1418201.1 hypothetical protein FE697_020430 [Mumia zhuanghuii]